MVVLMRLSVFYSSSQRTGLGDVAVFENRQTVTAAKFINKSSLLFQLPGVISRLELKLISKQKVENIFDAPPYCQTACCRQWLFAIRKSFYSLVQFQILLIVSPVIPHCNLRQYIPITHYFKFYFIKPNTTLK